MRSFQSLHTVRYLHNTGTGKNDRTPPKTSSGSDGRSLRITELDVVAAMGALQ